MKQIHALFVVSVLALCLVHNAGAQTPVQIAPAKVGLFGSFNLNQHVADFRGLPGVPSCCPNYANGDGTGFMIGGLYELPLSDVLSLALRGDYSSHTGSLSAVERTMVDDVNGDLLNASVEHLLEPSIGSIGLQPLLGYKVFGGLSLHAGTRFAYVMSKTYDQKETLLEPAGTGTFENGLRQRNLYTGTIEDATALQAAVVGGVSFALPMNAQGSLLLVPEIFYHYSLTPVVKNLSWNMNTLTTGVSLKYVLPQAQPELRMPEPAPLPPAPKPTPPPPKRPALAVAVDAVAVNNDGSENRVVQVRIEEFVSTNLRPLLPYIFFDEGSSSMDARYAALPSGETQKFSIDALHELETLEVYHHLLDIVGLRMTQQAKAKLTLIGCNANTGTETGNKSLSLKRAETVKAYLVDTWRIEPSRISVQSRNLPEKASRVDDQDGIAENRRVELYSNDDRILEPVQTSMVEKQVTPPIVRFIPSVTSEAGIRSWALRLDQDRKVRSFDGSDNVPPRIEWNIREDLRNFDAAQAPVRFTLSVQDREGQTMASAPSFLPIEHVTLRKKRSDTSAADKEIARFSLILFDFDKSEIAGANRRIAGLIQPTIRESSTVSITGYTDRMGDADYNTKLSQERAQNTAKLLKMPNATVLGLGKEKMLYNNDLPEGRYYSRTVDVVVETPVKKTR